MVAMPDSDSTEPTFRQMRLDEVDEVFGLIDASFERWPNLQISVPRIEHFRWKVSAPQGLEPSSDVIEIGGRIVGYSGGSRRDVWVQGQLYSGSHGGDQCIHPDFQEQGLTRPWREWRDEQRAKLPPRVGMSEGSTHPRLIRSSKRRGQRLEVANHVERLTLPLDLGAIARGGGASGDRVTPRSLFRAARTLQRMLAGRLRWRSSSEVSSTIEVRDVESFDERADALWERVREEFDYAVMRNRDYLNWRYIDPRAGVYRVRAAMDGDELAGFMVTGANGTDEVDAQVVDLLVLPGRNAVLRALVADAVAHARGEGAETVTVQMPQRHPYREAFLRAGFVKAHRVTTYGFRLRGDSPLEFAVKDPNARIHVAFGDGDHI